MVTLLFRGICAHKPRMYYFNRVTCTVSLGRSFLPRKYRKIHHAFPDDLIVPRTKARNRLSLTGSRVGVLALAHSKASVSAREKVNPGHVSPGGSQAGPTADQHRAVPGGAGSEEQLGCGRRSARRRAEHRPGAHRPGAHCPGEHCPGEHRPPSWASWCQEHRRNQKLISRDPS